ncbi:MAG: hypothetical protein ACD_79C01298G0003 [uncultured bacterium]|nr:MAG: hypothetical protein ACD_79C01298G0003 [uncultured bacterium]
MCTVLYTDFSQIFNNNNEVNAKQLIEDLKKNKYINSDGKIYEKKIRKLSDFSMLNLHDDFNNSKEKTYKVLLNKIPKKVFFYRMTIDSGVAPNPFWGKCTIAICTPNSKDYSLIEGDWIIGYGNNNPKEYDLQFKFIYAMKITQKLGISSYYNDINFVNKKPHPDPTIDNQGNNLENFKINNWKTLCGDKFYQYASEENSWTWTKYASYHNFDGINKDTGGTPKDGDKIKVFISEKGKFIYFGNHDFINLFPEDNPVRIFLNNFSQSLIKIENNKENSDVVLNEYKCPFLRIFYSKRNKIGPKIFLGNDYVTINTCLENLLNCAPEIQHNVIQNNNLNNPKGWFHHGIYGFPNNYTAGQNFQYKGYDPYKYTIKVEKTLPEN